MVSTDPVSRPPLLRRLLQESPLVVGVVLGWWLLWLRGSAWVVPDFPSGMGWEAYFQLARNLSLGEDSGPSNVTLPLYPWLLQFLGERGSYNAAAALIASVALDAIVVAAGLIARLLAGPWAGGLAALVVPMIDEFAQASRWSNLYPLLGATTGLSLAAALAASRCRNMAWPLVSGVLAAAACCTDWRGAIVVPVSAALVFLSLGRSWRTWLALVAFGVGLAAGPVFVKALSVRVDQPWDMQLDGERVARVESIALVESRVREACQGALSTDLPSRAWFGTDCSRSISWWNRLSAKGHVPMKLNLLEWLALLSLVPAPKRRLRSVLESAAVLGVGAVLLWTLSRWAVLPGRYVVHLSAPICAIAPVGVFRILQWVAVFQPRVGQVAMAMVGLGWGGWLWGQMDPSKVRATIAAPDYVAMMQDLAARLQPGDALMDCAGGSVELAYLPRLLHDRSKGGSPMDPAACVGWIDAPMSGEGAQYLLLGAADDRPGEPVSYDPAATGRWTEIHSFHRGRGDVGLWRFDG